MEENKYILESRNLVEESAGSYNPERDFTTLDAWRKAHLVKLFFYNKVISTLPVEEKYNLNIQIRKAGVSVTANISEGYGRFYFQEGIQFYRISRGSMYELKDHLISCFDLKFIDRNILEEGLSLIEDAKVTLSGYINFVKSQKENS